MILSPNCIWCWLKAKVIPELQFLTDPMLSMLSMLQWELDCKTCTSLGKKILISVLCGRAFCAGGDIVGLYKLINEGRIEDCKECFRTVYSFIYLVGTYLNPNVAILDGITMGSRAGVSILGMFRVATDRTVFATPETLIGFHTDAGASFHLSHLPGYWGIETLDKCFSRGTVEEIIDALTLKEVSPLSLKVCQRSIREGRFQTLDQCLVHEYRMSVQGFYGQIFNDFREGVRARMVEKDYAPKRNPPSLEQVSNDMVDQYFFTY
ncbi:hypothetical protein VitviT2T_023391 [Vitis vinifera]|uniref:3-hydroxyisobutyryl-CoA hydrolase n=1 Tax=Vitis vinifera TaxID=29760 RepID=A0ABY9DCL2_VITVI|nr:hypothetical protein VitviT2T_023391 [Vitis vinifera]